MKRVKATIEVLVDVDGWFDKYDWMGRNNDKKPTKKDELEHYKDTLQDYEIFMNNNQEYKVISVKETKQERFKW